MIITNVSIRNFQSIVSADMPMAEWVSIVGESDRGKSAIIRAIRALLENRSGESYIRHGAKSCSVTINLASGHRIAWNKSRGKSGEYIVTNPDGGQVLYSKTAREVPEAVTSLIRMTTDVGGEAFAPGLQGQHDGPFLLSDTARRRAQILGTLDGTSITMAAETILRRAQRTAQEDVKAAEREAERLDEVLLPYAALPAAEEALAEAESRSRALGERSEGLAAVRLLSDAYWTAVAAWQREAVLVDAWTLPAGLPSVDALLERFARLQEVRAIHARLTLLGIEQQGIYRLLAVFPDLSGGDALFERAIRAAEARDLSVALARVYVDRDVIEARIEEAAVEGHEAAEALAALAGEPCPECGQPIEAAVLA